MKPDYQILPFKDAAAWRKWLVKNHSSADGVWIRIYKKTTGLPTVTYDQALDDALCYGWIDGQVKSYDEQSYIQKFTPRRKASLWSKRNIEHIARLTAEGLMTPTGIAEVNRAKEDGRWDAAYDMPSQMSVPEDFLKELKKHPKANQFYQTLNKTNHYAIAWRLQTAKTTETRDRRMAKIIQTLQAEQKIV